MTNSEILYATIFNTMPSLTSEDQQFLSDIFSRFPRVLDGFSKFSAMPPIQRIPNAARILEKQPRSGWLRFNLVAGARPILNTHAGEYNGPRWLSKEDTEAVTETVLEHSAEAQELYMSVFNTSPHKQWGMEIMKFHDFTEAIIGDFTPHDPISKIEKQRLEMLGLELLTEGRNQGDLLALHIHNCLQIYEGNQEYCATIRDNMLGAIHEQRQNAQIKPFQIKAVQFLEKLYGPEAPDYEALTKEVVDIDTLHMAVRSCRMMKNKHPQMSESEAHTKMEEFWTYIDKKLQTPPARAFYNIFRECYLREDLGYRTSYNHACMHTGLQNLNRT